MNLPIVACDVAAVADFLLSPVLEIDEHEWHSRPEARARAAIGRAYYSLFLSLKSVVEPQRNAWKFPKHKIHKLLNEALVAELGARHPLCQKMRSLLHQRNNADYDLNKTFAILEAEGAVDTCYQALEDIDELTAHQLRGIADRIFDLHNDS